MRDECPAGGEHNFQPTAEHEGQTYVACEECGAQPPYYTDDSVTLHHGDCLAVLARIPDASIDAVVTDPPYELGFMGRGWDRSGIAYNTEVWAQCLRVLKPGGHLLAFGGSRTAHRLAVAIEDAGFEIRDSILWLYGSGFPKSHDVARYVDKQLGVDVTADERWVPTPHAITGAMRTATGNSELVGQATAGERVLYAPDTDQAKQWEGWGTALKPAHEPIVVARKPLAGTIAVNVLTHGVGGLNIDATRVAFQSDEDERESKVKNQHDDFGTGAPKNTIYGQDKEPKHNYDAPGRWPPNVVLDPMMADELDAQSGSSVSSGGRVANISTDSTIYGGGKGLGQDLDADDVRGDPGYGDRGGASRYFPVFRYEPKATSRERPSYTADDSDDTWASSGIRKRCTKCGKQEVNRPGSACTCDEPDFQPDPTMLNKVTHPTVKPLDLMRWLVRLVCPPDGVVLEPFAGSGTTAEACVIEGMRCIAIEKHAPYLPLIVDRLSKPIQIDLLAQLGGAPPVPRSPHEPSAERTYKHGGAVEFTGNPGPRWTDKPKKTEPTEPML